MLHYSHSPEFIHQLRIQKNHLKHTQTTETVPHAVSLASPQSRHSTKPLSGQCGKMKPETWGFLQTMAMTSFDSERRRQKIVTKDGDTVAKMTESDK